MRKIRSVVVLLCVVISVAAVIFTVNHNINRSVRITEYNFAHNDIPDAFNGYKIMLISDLHEAPFSEQILRHIEDTEPDVILFCGDIVQLPDYSFEEAKRIAEGVGGRIPMYAVSGNHETQNKEYEHIVGNLWDAGIEWLENDSKKIKRSGAVIYIIGAKDIRHDNVLEDDVKSEVISEIENELPVDSSAFTILINHRANMYPYLKNIGVDLILSGHLHGGVVRLPFLGGLFGDKAYKGSLLPEYDYGLYHEGAAAMIVSAGCDKNPSKARFMNRPEVVLITLDSR